MTTVFALYVSMIALSIRSQMQYRLSFLILCSTYAIGTCIDIVGIWVLFDRFKIIQGWTLSELALTYGILHIAFGITEAFAKVFDDFFLLVKNGEFDRILLRPRGTLLQVASRQFQLHRLGRVAQGFLVLLWSCSELHISLLSTHGIVILLAIIGTASLFYGLFIIGATICFWTTETLEIMNITTYGGVETGQYPMSIYPGGFRWIFTVLIPLACVAYYPAAIMLKHESFPLWAAALFPLAGVLFLIAACQFWKVGVHHYHSAGS